MPDAPLADEGPLLGVMGAARVLGIATATLRSWDRRYGLTPSVHTKGGHRRYNPQDMARLQAMGRMVRAGVPPAEAARSCLALPSDTLNSADSPDVQRQPGNTRLLDPSRQSSPDLENSAAYSASAVETNGLSQAVSHRPVGSDSQIRRLPVAKLQPGRALSPDDDAGDAASCPERGLARAAAALDSATCVATLRGCLAGRGAVATWEEVVRPLLARIGTRWANTGTGIEVEHVLSSSVTFTFSEHVTAVTTTSGAVSVVLASTPDEMHDIPMTVLAAALAEHGVNALHLGARTPGRALSDALARVRPTVVVLWAQDRALAQIPALPAMRPAPALLLCGPGWPDRVNSPVARDLAGALNRIGTLLGVGPLTHRTRPVMLEPYDRLGERR